MYLAQGNLTEALSIQQKAISIAPKLAILYLDLGKTHTLARDYQKAREAFGRAVALDPGSAPAGQAAEALERIKDLN